MRYVREHLPLPIQQIIGIGKDRFSIAVDVEKDIEWDGRGRSRSKEWTNHDNTRQILITEHGGPEYGGVWMKDIHLMLRGEVASGELMRMQEVIRADGTVEYNIYLDVTTDREAGKWPTATTAWYRSCDSGKLAPFHSGFSYVKRGEYSKMSDEEFEALWRVEMAQKGIRHANELPPYIDMSATVIGFIGQIQRGDFSKPVLVARYPSVKEIETIEENARQRAETSQIEDQLRRERYEEEKQKRERKISRRVGRKVEGYLPSGRARQRGAEFANHFEQIKPQLKELGCSVLLSGHTEDHGKSYITTIKLEIDKDYAQAVETLLEESGIEVDRHRMHEDGRLTALRIMHEQGIINNDQYADELRTKQFVIFQGKHLSDRDVKRIRLDME